MKMPKPGTVYVAVQPDLGSVKVGCMTARSRRPERLGRYGWVLQQRLDLADVGLARDIEQAVLFDVRYRLLVPVHLTVNELPNGWTETASSTLVSADQMWELVGEQAGAHYLAPIVRKVPPRRTSPIPPRRTPGDTPRYSRAARSAAAFTARNPLNK